MTASADQSLVYGRETHLAEAVVAVFESDNAG
jgi:hypothetical protein